MKLNPLGVIVPALVLCLALGTTVVLAQNEVRRVPYRLATESGEAIEMRIHYINNYREVQNVDFDITVRKSDGVHQYRLPSAEGPVIVVNLTVAENKVTSAAIAADPAPQEAITLSISSRSGERLMFMFDEQGNNTGITSDRTGQQ